jgi:hypothetical protein
MFQVMAQQQQTVVAPEKFSRDDKGGYAKYIQIDG